MAAVVRMKTWSCPSSGVFRPWTLLLLVLFSNVDAAVGVPEPGLWSATVFNTSRPLILKKSMFKDTNIELNVVSFACPEEVLFTIHWYLKYYPCHNEFNNIEEMYDKTPLSRGESLDPNPFGQGEYIEHRHSAIPCNSGLQTFQMLKKAKAGPRPVQPHVEGELQGDDKEITEEYDSSDTAKNHSLEIKDNVIATTWKDGPYLLVVKFLSTKQDVKWNLTVNVGMKGSHGYISVTEWPLMIFYMVMCIVYILYALLWFVWSACYWKDLLRIQFWIAGVIFLGMVEKAVFCAEYENTNAVGFASTGLLTFAELVSGLKRTLARLLVIIVSLGYGIVKPGLGTVMHRVVGLGILYFAFASIEGVLRITGRSYSPGQHRLHRGGCGADRGGDGEGVQRQRLPPHAQELQPLLLSTIRDPVWQGDPPVGQPPGLLQLLRAIPPELPAQRVADPGRLTVERQPGAPRRRGPGGGGGRRCHGLPGLHVALLSLILLQPLLCASSFLPPAPQVEAERAAGKLGAGFVVTQTVR